MTLSNMINKSLFQGCFEPLKMSLNGFVLGNNKRTMHGAFGSGALQYRVIVASKPAVGAGKLLVRLPALRVGAAVVDIRAGADTSSDDAAPSRDSDGESGSSFFSAM